MANPYNRRPGSRKISDLVRTQRHQQGLAFEYLCKLAGVGKDALTEFERNKSIPLDAAVALVDALGYELVAVPKGQGQR